MHLIWYKEVAYHLNLAASVLKNTCFYSHPILRLAWPSIEPNVPSLSILHIYCSCLSAYILTTQHIKRKPVHWLSVSPISAVTISETQSWRSAILHQGSPEPHDLNRPSIIALYCTIHNQINSWTEYPHGWGSHENTCPQRVKRRAMKKTHRTQEKTSI